MEKGFRIVSLFMLFMFIVVIILFISGLFIYFLPVIILVCLIAFVIQVISAYFRAQKVMRQGQEMKSNQSQQNFSKNTGSQNKETDLIDVEYTIVEDEEDSN